MNAPVLDWSAQPTRQYFFEGSKDMRAVSLGIAAWGLVTGVAMVNSGMPVWAAVLLGFLVFAGSAQLAAIPLIAAGAPIWLILATAFCINLRFVIFSVQVRPYFTHLPLRWRTLLSYLLGDLTAVMFLKRFEKDALPADEPTRNAHLSYYFGACTTNWFAWNSAQLIGILGAAYVPQSWGLAFAGILALLGVTLSLLIDKLTTASAAIACIVAVLFVALPLKLNLLLSIIAGVAIAMLWQAAIAREAKRMDAA
jgi:predicted branched-subunit amino acid permease